MVPGSAEVKTSGWIPLFDSYGDKPLRSLIVRCACQAAVELHRSEAGRSEDTHQFRSRVEPDTPGEDFVLWTAYPNLVVLDPAPALPDDTLLQQVLIPLSMPMPDAGLERAG